CHTAGDVDPVAGPLVRGQRLPLHLGLRKEKQGEEYEGPEQNHGRDVVNDPCPWGPPRRRKRITRGSYREERHQNRGAASHDGCHAIMLAVVVLVAPIGEKKTSESDQGPYECSDTTRVVIIAHRAQHLPSGEPTRGPQTREEPQQDRQ